MPGCPGIWVGTSQIWKNFMQENFELIFRSLCGRLLISSGATALYELGEACLLAARALLLTVDRRLKCIQLSDPLNRDLRL